MTAREQRFFASFFKKEVLLSFSYKKGRAPGPPLPALTLATTLTSG
jgi:hypothetical protein